MVSTPGLVAPSSAAGAGRAVAGGMGGMGGAVGAGGTGGAGSLALTGPLTAAVAPYAAGDATERLADGAAVLAGLIDLRGSVALAERLATIDAVPPVVEAADPAVVRAMLHTGVSDIEARLDEAFTHAFRPRYRLPTPQRGWLIVERSGLLDAPRPTGRRRRPPKPLRIAVRHLWAPLGEFLDTHLKRARFALRDLRVELEPRLIGLGEDAARLVQLDTALAEATSGTTEKLLRRVGHAAERAFTEAMTRAWREWPAEPSADDFTAGFSPEGWLGDVLAEAQALYRAVVHHERSRLEALVESACALARRAEPGAERDRAGADIFAAMA